MPSDRRGGGLPPGFGGELQTVREAPKDFPGARLDAPGEFGEAEPSPAAPKPKDGAPAATGRSDARPAAAPPPSGLSVAAAARAVQGAPRASAPGAIVDASAAPDLSNVPGAEPAEDFWVGTLPGAPVQNVDVAGINFPLFTETVVVVGGETQRLRHNGVVLPLSERQVAAILAGLKRKVIRWRDASKRRGYIMTLPTPAEAELMARRGRSRAFVAQPLDEPVGRYVYLVRGGRTSDVAFPASVVPPAAE